MNGSMPDTVTEAAADVYHDDVQVALKWVPLTAFPAFEEAEQVPVDFSGTLLVRQVPAAGKLYRDQVIGDLRPYPGHVVGLAHPLEVGAPQGQHRAGQRPARVLVILGHVLLACAVVVAGAPHR